MLRYKDKDWQASFESSRMRLAVFLKGDAKVVIAYEAQMLLKACYGGPWKMLYAMLRRELTSAMLHHLWPKWEWIRTRIFRRSQSEAIAAFDRESLECEEVDRMVDGL